MVVQWYTVFCKPRKEHQIADYLTTQNITVYNPTLKVKPVNPRAAKIRALFPRYVFVHTNLEEIGISTIQWIPGAVGLVTFGDEPAVVPDYFIQELRERIADIEAAGGLHLQGLQKGDRVEIKSGPFAGYEALFDLRLSDEDRVQVLLHWLGREIKVKINANAVEKRRSRH